VTRATASVRSQYREIFRFVRRRVGSSSDAEDLTQEVFASAAAAVIASSETAPPTLAWLYTVARRRLADAARRKRLDTVPLELVRAPEASVDEYGLDVARALETALRSLPEGQRRVVLMRLVGGRTFEEIATELGATEEACRMRFMRGLRQLRTELEKEGMSP
jgi:RNA polymerase sigma-70 factor (ECF subfamily)